MLGRSLKYEFMATARTFLPLFSALLLFSAINRIVFSIFPFISPFLFALYIFVLIGSFVAAAVFLIQRFYKSLTGDEGYLLLTLPVKAGTQVITKTIASFAWIVLTIIIAFLSIIVMITDKSIYTFIAQAINEMNAALTQAGKSPASLVLLIAGFLLVVLFEQMMRVYTSVSIGQLSNTNRAGFSVIAYLVLYFAINIIIMVPVTLIVLMQFFDINEIFSSTNLNIMNTMNDPKTIMNFIYLIFGIETAVMGTLSIVHFFVTKYIVKNKINLT